MILYHGSNGRIEQIDLAKGRIAKDFGKGFYLSPSLQNAKDWAERVTQREESGVPTVTTFELDERELESKDLKVKIFESYNLEWIDFILLNRQNRTAVNLHDYDIVIGPIADDSVGTQLFQFNRGYIDKNTLIQRLKGNKPKFIQYFFATEKAVNKLVLKDE
jgi:hypothetical protein